MTWLAIYTQLLAFILGYGFPKTPPVHTTTVTHVVRNDRLAK